MSLRRISAKDLITHLSSTPPPTHISIIDCRDEDFTGGNIKNARHFPSSEASFTRISYLWEELRQKHARDAKKMVVFHCMQSQIRGPTIASRFLHTVGEEELEEENFEIAVLDGGYSYFESFVMRHQDNELAKKVLENLEEEQ